MDDIGVLWFDRNYVSISAMKPGGENSLFGLYIKDGMKAEDLAEACEEFAKQLRENPNVELSGSVD